MKYREQVYVRQAQELLQMGEQKYLEIRQRARELAARLRQDRTMSASMVVRGERVLVTATTGYEIL